MGINAILFTLAAIGVAETAYLVKKRRAEDHPMCPIGGKCETVLSSKYNRLFSFVHNDVLGLLFYLGVCLAAILIELGVPFAPILNQAIVASVSIALALSFVLIYLQGAVIKAWCFWCVMSAATVALLFILLVLSGFQLA